MKEQKELRFRQIHLDFNTPDDIPGIGAKFDKARWQDCLKTAHANSITCFSCCHHGFSYHPTKVGQMHPNLNFNLLRAQVDASHEIDVNVPIYMTVGYNNRIAALNPGWKVISAEGKMLSPFYPEYQPLCLNSAYLDHVCRLTEEAAKLFDDADGIFFDILVQNQCCCPKCIQDMLKRGYDPQNEDHRRIFSNQVIENCCRKLNEAARSVRQDWPIYHNNTVLLQPGMDILLPYSSHIELESLPTAAHNYDHFPMLAAYCRTLEPDFLGMTAKFHTLWGDYGGFKHPNALIYECDAMLAQGSKCSIGDQLHPTGVMDMSSCRLIGAAYKDVQQKEPWCGNVTSAANVAMLATNAFEKKLTHDLTAETGVSRLLLEAHIPFDRIGDKTDFLNYKALILPDDLHPDAALAKRLRDFSDKGGRIILAGESLLQTDSGQPVLDLPLTADGIAQEYPNFVVAANDVAPDGIDTPFVMYRPSLNIRLNGGKSLGDIHAPYYNRSYRHFCSHIHAPNRPEPSGFQAGILTENTLYFAHPVFTLYAHHGNVMFKQFVLKAIRALLNDILPVQAPNMPSQGRVTLMHQKQERRYIAHALFATTITRGMIAQPPGPDKERPKLREVIEDLFPIYDLDFTFRLPQNITAVTLEPQGQTIPFTQEDGIIRLRLKKLLCHQMMVLHY